ETVAVRMSSHPVFQRVVTSFGGPLAAPSANRFGRLSPTSAGAVMKELGGRIPLILDGGACPEGLESTIVKILPGDRKPILRILRAGPITKDDLQPYGKVEWANGQPDKKGRVAAPEVPGQLPSHYAPGTPLRLLENPESFQPEPGRRYALLSYRGDAEDGYTGLTDWEQVLVLSPGSGKLPEAGLRLFHCLRALDELGVDEIIAEPVPLRDVGMAIMERLRRASYL
ncbi:MAG: Sua5/YciO/YrdC/YwlC family protein, partial [Verrucomicrobiales bacterium]|nr:Sua5/YciO/YrdC/YwlC family protein [Verrucomicrobiales bacterium]